MGRGAAHRSGCPGRIDLIGHNSQAGRRAASMGSGLPPPIIGFAFSLKMPAIYFFGSFIAA